MISVIIPVYNTAEYLDQCIASVVNQSYRDLEILLIDDGSIDGSLEKLLVWESRDSRISVIRKKTNSGVSASRNLGLEKAKGDCICFLDSDDWLEPDYYSKLFHSISQSGADVAFGGYRRITRRGAAVRLPSKPTGTVLPVREALSLCMPKLGDRRFDFYIWDKLYRKSALIRNDGVILFDTQYSMCEDVLWTVQVLLNRGSVVSCRSCGYNYRLLRLGNTTTVMSQYNDMKKCRDAVEANHKVYQLLSGMDPRVENYALQRVLFYRRYAFRTAANVNDEAAFREFREGYFADLFQCWRQDRRLETFLWLMRQFLAELRFRIASNHVD